MKLNSTSNVQKYLYKKKTNFKIFKFNLLNFHVIFFRWGQVRNFINPTEVTSHGQYCPTNAPWSVFWISRNVHYPLLSLSLTFCLLINACKCTLEKEQERMMQYKCAADRLTSNSFRALTRAPTSSVREKMQDTTPDLFNGSSR